MHYWTLCIYRSTNLKFIVSTEQQYLRRVTVNSITYASNLIEF